MDDDKSVDSKFEEGFGFEDENPKEEVVSEATIDDETESLDELAEKENSEDEDAGEDDE